jgi:glycosyltransferase involved in cell wall biosynthesis
MSVQQHRPGRFRTVRIAQLAPPFERVPPACYGGTERVVHALTEELVRRGHDVTLFASGDSTTSARLVPTVPVALWHDRRFADPGAFWSVAVARVYDRADEFDLIHSHVDYHAFPTARLVRTPTVTTLHGRLDLPELPPLFDQFPDMWVVSISDAQRRPLPRARWAGTVHNGVVLAELPPSFRPGRYLAFLGRISPEKGVDQAVEVARRAGMPLKVAARMPLRNQDDPGTRRDWEYFERVVQPLFAEPFVEYVGELGGEDKSRFLRDAAALLFPIDWPEPFGLAMIEAMASGTPVIARGLGSVPEVVRDGETGFIRDSIAEMAAACRELPRIDRRVCREHAERRFSAQAMADGYEAVYRRVLGEAAATGHTASYQSLGGVPSVPPPASRGMPASPAGGGAAPPATAAATGVEG